MISGIGYIAIQAITPASLKAEQQAKETLRNIQIVPASAQPSTAPADPQNDDPKGKPQQVALQRNHYLDAAIAALQAESNNLLCARAAYFRQLADQKQTELGVNPEQFLLDLLTAQNQELLTTATQTGGFSGTAELQSTGRHLTLDTLAISEALQGMYDGQSKSCLSEPYQAGENINNYLIRAQQYRAAVAQQVNQTIQQEAKPMPV